MRIALRNCGVINPRTSTNTSPFDGYQALGKVLTEMTPDDVIQTILDSGLRGRGGAGFHRPQWQLASGNRGNVQKYVCCNADEGDPGIYGPQRAGGRPPRCHRTMAIAGYAIGASQVMCTSAPSTPSPCTVCRSPSTRRARIRPAGQQHLWRDFCFDLDIKLGAGAFVCGEETALMTSIEASAASRVPVPVPGRQGLFGKPTILNNVETYANVPQIILKGADWFASMGTEKSKAPRCSRWAARSEYRPCRDSHGYHAAHHRRGDRRRHPGRQKFKAAQTGGPSGGCIPASLIDTPSTTTTCLPSAA